MKRVGYKGLSCLLVVMFLCLIVTGCGEGQDGLTGNSADGNLWQEEGADRQDDPANSPNGRQVITAVVTWPGKTVIERINAYNRSSSSYYVEIKNYGEVGNIVEPEDLETQLTLDILSGKGPDLVIWDSRFYSPALASEKLMVDLYGLMDADQNFHKEDYYENILQAFEMEGGLYALPASFSVDTVCGKAEELGTDRGVTESWEVGEMIEAFENSPHAEWLTSNHSKELAFRFVCYGCIGNFVDWGTGECRFDTPAFVELLELSDTFPSQPMFGEDFSYYGILRSGKVFWEPVNMGSPWDVARMRIEFGEDVLWPGYPVADGEKDLGGGVAAPCGECFSICHNGTNQEAAWDFIKSYLTADVQREMTGVPLLQSVSEARIQEALTVEYETADGVRQEKTRYEIRTEGEEIVRLSCITEEDADIYRSIIENTRRSYSNDSGMMEIIMEEARAYFEKDKDAAITADIIQNRVGIYVSERMK